jgi:hypothetical protein
VTCALPSASGGTSSDVLVITQQDEATGVHSARRTLTALRLAIVEGGRAATLHLLGCFDMTAFAAVATGDAAHLGGAAVEATAASVGSLVSAVAVSQEAPGLVAVVVQVGAVSRVVTVRVADSGAPEVVAAAYTIERQREVRHRRHGPYSA